MPDTEFRKLLKAIRKGEVLSARESISKDAPPAFTAHMIIDGNEYTVSVVPTQLGADVPS